MIRMLCFAIVGSFLASAVLAQTAPPQTAPSPAQSKGKGKATAIPQTPEGIECSKQADAKGLHGPERVRFRANCKKRLMKQKS